jgi:hypothetical protein
MEILQPRSPWITRIRRNHALEHATLNVLTSRFKVSELVGYSDMNGFWVIGNVDLDDLQFAVEEALNRLRRGERKLAVTENCGTNFVASGILAGIAAWVAMLGTGSGVRKKAERLPIVMALVTVVLILARPFGPVLQAKVTTDAEVGPLNITGMDFHHTRGLTVHRIFTSS